MAIHGPCPNCGNHFKSKHKKTYCSYDCYIKSPAFKKQCEKGLKASLKKRGFSLGEEKRCKECEKPIGRTRARKYCSRRCYRKYMSKRFDRWIASPQELALPQNYDEFLTQEELPCLVKDCPWRGHNLSYHMNMTHGISAREFKKLAGFNLRSGIISLPLQETLSSILRPWTEDTLTPGPGRPPSDGKEIPNMPRYQSLEGKEHRQKARALKMLESEPPARTCDQCGKVFQQLVVYGKTKYCSVACRDLYYSERNSKKQYVFTCGVCGSLFRGDKYQLRRIQKNMIVVCSYYCRQKRAAKIARGTWRKTQEFQSKYCGKSEGI